MTKLIATIFLNIESIQPSHEPLANLKVDLVLIGSYSRIIVFIIMELDHPISQLGTIKILRV